MRFNQQQIVAFNAACTHGSFSAAARRLGVTQSSVTQHIAKFEAIVGVRLFERGQSGLSLTPAGRKIRMVTEEIGLLHAVLEERIGEYSALDLGHLRIVSTATRPAMGFMRQFADAYPGVDLSYSHASWRECAAMLRGRDADVAIFPEPEHAEGLKLWKIEQRGHTAIVPEDHPFASRAELSLAELVTETLVLASTRSFARHRLEMALKRAGIAFGRTLQVAASPTALEAAAHGLGIAFGHPDSSQMPANLRAVTVGALRDPYWVVAACNADVQDLTMIRRFLDFMP